MSSGVSACGFAGAEVFAGHAEMAPWLPLSPRRCRVRASGRAGSRTGRSPAAGGGAGSVTDATDKDYEVTPGTYSVLETVPTREAVDERRVQFDELTPRLRFLPIPKTEQQARPCAWRIGHAGASCGYF